MDDRTARLNAQPKRMQDLMDKNPEAYDEFGKLIKDPQHVIPGKYREVLKKCGLLMPDNTIHPAVREMFKGATFLPVGLERGLRYPKFARRKR